MKTLILIVVFIIVVTQPVMAQQVVEPKELWRIGDSEDDEGAIFGFIEDIIIDQDNNIYVAEAQQKVVLVFNAQGESIRSIGRYGEGPGEFFYINDLFFNPDSLLVVLQWMPIKLELFSKDGESAGSINLPDTLSNKANMMFRADYVGNNLVTHISSTSFPQPLIVQENSLEIINQQEELYSIYSETKIINTINNSAMEEEDYFTPYLWSVGLDDKVYIAPYRNQYQIEVFNLNGQLERVIEKDFESRRRNNQEIEFAFHVLYEAPPGYPQINVEMSDYDQDIIKFYSLINGQLWVLSSYGCYDDKPEGSMGIFDVFDQQGRFVEQISLQGEGDPVQDNYYFLNNRLYVVTEVLNSMMMGKDSYNRDEAKPMVIICYQLW